jgi:hypothetical protein
MSLEEKTVVVVTEPETDDEYEEEIEEPPVESSITDSINIEITIDLGHNENAYTFKTSAWKDTTIEDMLLDEYETLKNVFPLRSSVSITEGEMETSPNYILTKDSKITLTNLPLAGDNLIRFKIRSKPWWVYLKFYTWLMITRE